MCDAANVLWSTVPLRNQASMHVDCLLATGYVYPIWKLSHSLHGTNKISQRPRKDAKSIVNVTATGERDPETIKDRALNALGMRRIAAGTKLVDHFGR